MAQYLIAFNDEWVPEHTLEQLRAKAESARAVIEEMTAAGVFVFSDGGLDESTVVCSVDPSSGSPIFTDGPFVETKEHLGGFAVVDVADDAQARYWAGRIAVAVGWPQEVHRFPHRHRAPGRRRGPRPRPERGRRDHAAAGWSPSRRCGLSSTRHPHPPPVGGSRAVRHHSRKALTCSSPPSPTPCWPSRALAEALADAPRLGRLDLTAPAGLRPFLVDGLVAGRAHGAAGDRHRTRGRGADRGARHRCRPRRGRPLPELGDAAARAAQPAQRHRRPPAGRAAPAAPPRRRRGHRAAAGRGRAGPVDPAAAGARARRPRAGRARAGRHRRARRRRTPARGRGVHPGRPGGEARRVRGPRRAGRRLPADRAAPDPGGVLGRRGRGDPLVRGRRPAHHREGRPAVGAAVPRAAAHRRRTPPRGRAGRGPPPAGRDDRQDRGRASRSRGWSRWRRCSSTSSSCSST